MENTETSLIWSLLRLHVTVLLHPRVLSSVRVLRRGLKPKAEKGRGHTHKDRGWDTNVGGLP